MDTCVGQSLETIGSWVPAHDLHRGYIAEASFHAYSYFDPYAYDITLNSSVLRICSPRERPGLGTSKVAPLLLPKLRNQHDGESKYSSICLGQRHEYRVSFALLFTKAVLLT